MLYAAVDDALLPLDDAGIPLDNKYYAYGIGVYETLKVRSKKIFFVEDHLTRLFHSAEIIGLKVDVSAEILRRRLNGVLEKGGIEDMNIRIMLIKKNSGA